MATITVDTFLDGGTARTAGEAWTCNGGRLTVRTDTRVHANAPATMTGTLGSVSISASLGGGYTLDGQNVRWLAYNTGTGNVPAIGTSVTQGGVSGYLLGVWASLTSAPTAVGAAVPATGFLKFREVTGGPYAAGALTGIGASAVGADVTGWIEVVHDQAAAITVPRLGDFTVRGAWFELGTTTGVANQLVQVPTNGSATTYVPGVWIATTASPSGAEDWEFWPSVYAAAFITTNFGTDARSKFVCMETNGNVRLGHNGTVAVGQVPPAGRRIRIPNVLGRQCLTATRAVNELPNATQTTRPDFNTAGAGAIDINAFATDWWLSFAQPYSVKLHHVATFDYVAMSEVAGPVDVYDGGNGVSGSYDVRSFNLTSCFAGGTVDKWAAPRHQAGTSDHAFEVLSCVGQTVSRVTAGVLTYARSSGYGFSINQSSNVTLTSCTSLNAAVGFTTCTDCTMTNLDYVDRYVGTTNATTPLYAITTTAVCNNILVDGIKFGLNGTIANTHPYLGIVSCNLSNNCTFRNFGTRAAFLTGGSANQAAYLYLSGGNNRNTRVQRCYMNNTRTGLLNTVNSDKNSLYEHVYGDFADAQQFADLNGHAKNCGFTGGVTGQSSVYGTHFYDAFVSDTVGRLTLAMNEPTAETTAVAFPFAGTPKFTSAGNLVLAAVSDQYRWEQDYWCLGVTSLANAAPTVSGTNVTFSSGSRWGNHDLYYKIDKGAGWSPSWLNFNQTNLAAETGIDPAIGFKLQFRATCAIASTTNLLTFVRIDTVSSLAAQTANLYPLDVATVTVSGLVVGSRVKATKVSDGAVLFNGAAATSEVSFTTDYIGAVNLEARKGSAAPYYQPWVSQVSTTSGATVQAIALQVQDE